MDELDDSTAYFLMADKSLRGLKEELDIIMGEDQAGELFYRMGFRAGEEAVKDNVVDTDDFDSIEKLKRELPEHWIHIGLSSIEVLDGDVTNFNVALSDSLEAKAMRSLPDSGCNFTRGFLEGVVSTLFSSKYAAEEIKCVQTGESQCIFNLKLDEDPLLPIHEDISSSNQKFKLKQGVSYMIDSATIDDALEVFTDQVTHGFEGIIITRMYPTTLKNEYGLKKTPVLWLSKEHQGDVPILQPGQLGLLHHKIDQFFKKSSKGVVLLDGLEYLVTQNSFYSVLKVVQLIRDKVSRYQRNLIVPLSPQAFDQKDFSLIARELVPYNIKKRKQSIEAEKETKMDTSDDKSTPAKNRFSKLIRKSI